MKTFSVFSFHHPETLAAIAYLVMVEVISLAGMLKFFKEDTNCIEKGELKYKSDFVLEVKLIGHKVEAVVRASMKDKSYKVSLRVDGDGGISSASCKCSSGKWLCSHMAAASIYVNKKAFSRPTFPTRGLLDQKFFKD